MNSEYSRRSFLGKAAATSAIALPSSALLASTASASERAAWDPDRSDVGRDFDTQTALQIQIEATRAFFTSFYESKNEKTADNFSTHFAKSNLDRYEDGTLGFRIEGSDSISATFAQFIPAIANALGTGRFSRIYNVAGDLRYGAIVEYVNLRNTFFSTNGMTVQTVFDLDGGLIARDIDYWDSGELGSSDVVGPPIVAGVAVPLGPIHPGGIPRTSSVAPPGQVAISSGPTGRPSASAAMVKFSGAFHDALSAGSAAEVSKFFAEDALLVHPLIHQGPFLYGNYDQTIQIRGRSAIANFFRAVLDALPDGKDSKLVHVVGSMAGGGFEWKAGGASVATGLDRTGLSGCTSLNLFNNRIQRMGVRFDTFQMPRTAYDAIKLALLRAGVTDQ